MLLMIMAMVMAMTRAMTRAMKNHANKEYAQLMGRSWLMTITMTITNTITTTKTMEMPLKNLHSWWEGVDLCSGLHGADWPKHVQLHRENIWQQGEEKFCSKSVVLFFGKILFYVWLTQACPSKSYYAWFAKELLFDCPKYVLNSHTDKTFDVWQCFLFNGKASHSKCHDVILLLLVCFAWLQTIVDVWLTHAYTSAQIKNDDNAFSWSIWDLSLQVIHQCLCHGDGCNKSFESAAGSKSNQWPLFIKTSIYATRDYLLCVLHITTCATKLNMLGTEIHVNMFEFQCIRKVKVIPGILFS